MIKSIDSKDKYNLKEIIYKIASNVPSSKVLGFVAKVSDLINSSTENELLIASIQCLFNWNKEDKIIKNIIKDHIKKINDGMIFLWI